MVGSYQAHSSTETKTNKKEKEKEGKREEGESEEEERMRKARKEKDLLHTCELTYTSRYCPEKCPNSEVTSPVASSIGSRWREGAQPGRHALMLLQDRLQRHSNVLPAAMSKERIP